MDTAAWNDVLRNFRLSISVFLRLLKYRWITIHRIFIILGVSVVLSTFYYAYTIRDGHSLDVNFRKPLPPENWAKRASQVKEAFRHAYRGYQSYSFPYDELMPLSNMTVNNFNGWGVTIVDSIDTMLLMGLENEYEQALQVIENTNFSLSSNQAVPFFETVIRYLGGLLSAYALTNNDLLRQKADELATKLAPVFNTNSGFPAYAVDTYKGIIVVDGAGSLAEIASFQMEYTYLGKITGKREHIARATLITDLLYTANLTGTGGMYPWRWNISTGIPSSSSLTVGAHADSAQEYTLKQYLMTARTDKHNLEMYLRMTSHVIGNLLYLSPKRRLLYVTDVTKNGRWSSASHNFEHLACFFPGLLALGVYLLPLNDLDTLGINATKLMDDLLPADRRAYVGLSEFNLTDLHLWAAKGIAETCYMMYVDQPTGLGPEEVRMDVDRELGEIRWIDELRMWRARIEGDDGNRGWWEKLGYLWGEKWEQRYWPPGVGDKEPWHPSNKNVTIERWEPAGKSRTKQTPQSTYGRDYSIKNPAYYLRPETVESMYILWRTTGDLKWRHRGWKMFQAIERYAKTPSGYTILEDVCTAHPTLLDGMPSYFLAETLKYLYLMFLDEDPLPLDKWVFNTEAHPLPVFEWTMHEREAYGIL